MTFYVYSLDYSIVAGDRFYSRERRTGNGEQENSVEVLGPGQLVYIRALPGNFHTKID
ncbi:MAG: hypothetical protein F6J93_38030 [Oscillatoria sp. SIO1A7]|nr:hypothetical protein [Oscillatoria sp. SIO1A7]